MRAAFHPRPSGQASETGLGMMPWSTLAMVTLVPFGRAANYSKFRRGRFGAPSPLPGAGSGFAKER